MNKLYRLLEIDVDGIFQALLLLKKKKSVFQSTIISLSLVVYNIMYVCVYICTGNSRYAAKTVEIRDGECVGVCGCVGV